MTKKKHNKAFGMVLRDIRKRRNKTQEELGLDSGLARNTISLLELGDRSPTLDTIELLCEVLEVTLVEFAQEIEQKMTEMMDG